MRGSRSNQRQRVQPTRAVVPPAINDAVQVGMVALMATPLLYLVVWQVVFRLWPSACQAPDGSILLCILDERYTRPRDLTAVAISLVIALVGAVVVYITTRRSRP